MKYRIYDIWESIAQPLVCFPLWSGLSTEFFTFSSPLFLVGEMETKVGLLFFLLGEAKQQEGGQL